MKKSESFVIPTVNQTEAGARWDSDAHGEEGLVFTGFDNPLPDTNWLQLYTDVLRHNVPDLIHRPDFAPAIPMVLDGLPGRSTPATVQSAVTAGALPPCLLCIPF